MLQMALCLLSTLLPPTLEMIKNEPKVVVIGAGIAGLTAAYRLKEKGIDVELYEARNRVGGRILTARVGGIPSELGAQSITDGGEAKHLRKLIDEFGLETSTENVNLNHFFYTGEKMVPKEEIYQKQFDPNDLKVRLTEIAQKAATMREVLDQILSPEDPLYQTLSTRLAAYEGGSVDQLSSYYEGTLYHMLLNGVCAAHRKETEQENWLQLITLKEGNSSLTQALAKTLGDRVHLDHVLQSVSKKSNGSYHLTFQGGKQIDADILVLAIPCSVYSDISFENVIPKERLETIESIRYGTNAKILVPFSAAPKKRLALVNDHLVAFFEPGCQTLVIFYADEAAAFSPETIQDRYVRERPMLEMGFPEHCPSYSPPVFASDQPYVSYDGPVGYSWPSDPYAKGSYSYISAGQDALFTALQKEGETFVKTLFAPIDQTLYFAGEHATILLDVPGTMEAACESGDRTAEQIGQLILEKNMSTVDYYNQNAQEFFDRTMKIDLTPSYDKFLSYVAPQSKILDAGCGSGRDSLAFKKRGHTILAFDPSTEMVRLSSALLNQPTLQHRFQDLSYDQTFDAIWANASLIHVPYEDLRSVFEKIHRALKPGGIFFATFKKGDARREADGRVFYDMDAPSIALYLEGLFEPLETWERVDLNQVAPSPSNSWFNILLKKK